MPSLGERGSHQEKRPHGGGPLAEVHVLTLRRAAALVGGEHELALLLKVDIVMDKKIGAG